MVWERCLVELSLEVVDIWAILKPTREDEISKGLGEEKRNKDSALRRFKGVRKERRAIEGRREGASIELVGKGGETMAWELTQWRVCRAGVQDRYQTYIPYK